MALIALVGLIVLAGVAFFLVPLAACPLCDGVMAGIRPDSRLDSIFCGCCQGDARLTLSRRWSWQIEHRR
jgi:hypothetical protein